MTLFTLSISKKERTKLIINDFIYLYSAQSNHVNKARLRVLQERQQILDSLFEDTQQNILHIPDDQESYTELMEGLILQGLYALMDSDVSIRVREADVEIAQFASERASQKFQETVKQQSNITISDNYLPANR